jgi:hypothetical protein
MLEGLNTDPFRCLRIENDIQSSAYPNTPKQTKIVISTMKGTPKICSGV